MGKFNLTEAAKDILLGEGSKEAFDANIASKKGQRGGERAPHGEVGKDRVASKTAYGTNDAGEIGQSPERTLVDELPDYLKGVPGATPPGATPPQGSEKQGVGITKAHGPQDTMGRTDIMEPTKSDATSYENIRDRIAGKLPSNTFGMNPGATFQHYDGTAAFGNQSQHVSAGGVYGEDVEALLQGENLSEEFKEKAATIFEAAVMARVTPIVEDVENQLFEQFEIAVEEIKEELAAKVDDYLNYMVEEWMKDNELAIHTGLKAEIVEDFISGLHNLFAEHYINIPEEKVDVVEELTSRVEELESELNEQIEQTIELNKELNEQKKIEAIYTACEGLSQTQVEKLKALAENVEYTTEEDFDAKLSTLKESYFKADVKVANNLALDEEVEIEEEKIVNRSSDPSMDLYAKTISQTLIK
jgi:hypothetical protein